MTTPTNELIAADIAAFVSAIRQSSATANEAAQAFRTMARIIGESNMPLMSRPAGTAAYERIVKEGSTGVTSAGVDADVRNRKCLLLLEGTVSYAEMHKVATPDDPQIAVMSYPLPLPEDTGIEQEIRVRYDKASKLYVVRVLTRVPDECTIVNLSRKQRKEKSSIMNDSLEYNRLMGDLAEANAKLEHANDTIAVLTGNRGKRIKKIRRRKNG